MNRIVLASSSPRRAELIKQLGIPLVIHPSFIQETGIEKGNPQEIVLANAFEKAKCVATLYPNDFVIGADTIVVLNDKVFEKPRDKGEAAQMLKTFSGKRQYIFTGISIQNQLRNIIENYVEQSIVAFHDLSEAMIEAYLNSTNPLDKAGGYNIQDEASKQIIRSYEGSFTNIMGLPMTFLKARIAYYKD